MKCTRSGISFAHSRLQRRVLTAILSCPKTIQKEKFTDRDRRFYTELVYGTLRSLNYVDYIIGILSSRKKNSLDPVCLAVLRMGLYQLFLWIKYLRRQLVMKP